MPEYDLYVRCSECERFHYLPLGLSLEKSFKVRLVSDVFDHEIPNRIRMAIDGKACPKTGGTLRCEDPAEMVLVDE
jgi:hypothetical protein